MSDIHFQMEFVPIFNDAIRFIKEAISPSTRHLGQSLNSSHLSDSSRVEDFS